MTYAWGPRNRVFLGKYLIVARRFGEKPGFFVGVRPGLKISPFRLFLLCSFIPRIGCKVLQRSCLDCAIATNTAIAINLILPNTLQLLANLPILGSIG